MRGQPGIYRYVVDLDTAEGVREVQQRALGLEPVLDMVRATMTKAALKVHWGKPKSQQKVLAAAEGWEVRVVVPTLELPAPGAAP